MGKKVKVEIEKNIKSYVESFFEDVDYSKEVYMVKEKIIEKLNEEYKKERELNKKNAFEIIVNRYNSLESMVKGINYNTEEISNWFDKRITISYDDFCKTFKREKLFFYIITLFGIIALRFLVLMLLYTYVFYIFILLSAFFIILDIVLVKKHNFKITKESLSVDSKKYLENFFDTYFKKCLIWLLIFFITLLDFSFNMVTIGFNSKKFELLEELRKSSSSLDIVIFFLLKNIFIMVWLNKKIDYENKSMFKKTVYRTSIVSVLYFIVAVIIYYEFEKIFVFSPYIITMTIYIIFAVIYYIICTKKYTYSRRSLSVNPYLLFPIIVLLLAVGVYFYLSRDIWLIQPYINSIPYIYEGNSQISYDESTGIYTIVSNKEDFKMLQLTDIHLGGGVISYDKDSMALEAVYKLLNYTKPDLVVVTGDLTYPVGLSSFSFNNKAPVSQFATFMRNTGIPWVFTFGNHDTESMAIGSEADLEELYKLLSWKTSRNLLYPYVQPKVNGKQTWGRNNQLVELRNNDGTLNQALFLIDSNAYVGAGFSKYDYIHDDQVEWYKNEVLRLNAQEGKTISTLEFFHIPLQQYKTAYDLFMKGSDEVKYYFGSNDEKTKDKVCASKYPSKLFDTAKELGTSKGFFCGHDHYNNMSLEYQGIRLTYGMSIDYLVEPGIARDVKQRGATLITAHKNSDVDIEQIPLMNISK